MHCFPFSHFVLSFPVNFLLCNTSILLTVLLLPISVLLVCRLVSSIVAYFCRALLSHESVTDCDHLSARVSTQHDRHTTSRDVRVCSEPLFLSLHTVSAGADSLACISWCRRCWPSCTKRTNSSWGSRGREGKESGAIAPPCCRLFTSPSS